MGIAAANFRAGLIHKNFAGIPGSSSISAFLTGPWFRVLCRTHDSLCLEYSVKTPDYYSTTTKFWNFWRIRNVFREYWGATWRHGNAGARWPCARIVIFALSFLQIQFRHDQKCKYDSQTANWSYLQKIPKFCRNHILAGLRVCGSQIQQAMCVGPACPIVHWQVSALGRRSYGASRKDSALKLY